MKITFVYSNNTFWGDGARIFLLLTTIQILVPQPANAPTVAMSMPSKLCDYATIAPLAREVGMADPKEICDTFYLALTIYREARGEPLAAKIGVAWTVLNRVAHPTWWGNSIDAVVSKRYQYSSFTDPADKQLTKWPVLTDVAWQNCLQCAIECLNGTLADPTSGATHYYDDSITAPYWIAGAKYCGKLGRLNFYQRTS